MPTVIPNTDDPGNQYEVSPLTDLTYARLPEFYRNIDPDQSLALLRVLSAIIDGTGLGQFYEDIQNFGDTLLNDQASAPIEWINWLAQHLGVTFNPAHTEEQRRTAVANASSGWRSGTVAALEAAVRPVLTPSNPPNPAYVRVIRHYGGDPWVIGVETLATESPGDTSIIANAIEDARARPAGFAIEFASFAASWDTIETAHPTWADWEAAGTWNQFQSTT